MQTSEIITSVEVRHVPNTEGTPAHIRVMGVSSEGRFTIRTITGLRTDRIEKKTKEAIILAWRLVGLEVKVVTRTVGGQVKRTARVVNHTTLPDWISGDWSKVSPT